MLKYVKEKIGYIVLMLIGVFCVYFLFHTIFSYNVAHTNSNINKKEAEDKMMEESKYAGVGIATSIEEEKTYRSAIHYPVFESDAINAKINSYLDKAQGEFEKTLEGVNKQSLYNHPANFSLSFTIHQVVDGLYSIVFTEESYKEEDDVKLVGKVFVVDTNKGKFIQVDEILNNDVENRNDLYKVIKNSFLESKYKQYFLQNKWDEWVQQQDFSNMYLTDDSVVFLFDKNELTIGTAGMPEISIPIEQAASFFKKEWKEKLLSGKETEETKVAQDEKKQIEEEDKQVQKEEPSTGKRVALTFDDGPHATYTPEVLDLLKSYNAKATFFLLGSRVDFYPDIVQRIVNEGHEVGNHTWDHRDLTKLGRETIRHEINDTNEAIKKAAGVEPALFRPPYGAMNQRVMEVLDVPEISWTVDTLDWKYRDPEHILSIVKENTHDGSIILMHDIHGTSVEGLKLVLSYLEKEGYEFVTVTDL